MEQDFVIITDNDEIIDETNDSIFYRSIARYLNSSQGKASLAQSMIAPLRRNIDYQSIGRKIFLVEEMPQGGASVFYSNPPSSGEDE